MATGPALSTAKSGRIYVRSNFRDIFSALDVLYADQFEGDNLTFADEAEKNFYRGAPPKWWNFYLNEKSATSGNGTLFVKRDGYEKLKEQIQVKRKLPALSTVKLFHQSGSGGTTMAMQVLWDLKKTFRCAVLTNSTSDIERVAQEVVQLFTAGSQGHQNTVLLLLNDEQILDKLQESIMMTFKEKNIDTYMPVAVLLSCVRKEVMLPNENVFLKRVLSDKEEQKFREKKKELTTKYGKQIIHLHGFNIMQTNFSQEYIEQACQVIRSCSKAQRPLKAQLAAFLSLLNSYVPGSYLMESQCLDFLRFENYTFEEISVEEKMHPFSHLIVTFQEDEQSERKVHMAHTLIAKRCTDLLAGNRVTRSDTARNFLNNFYRYEDHGEFPQYLLGFIKDMLTKRQFKTKFNPASGLEVNGDQERFSKLILDIQKEENKVQCTSVLKVASNKFPENPFFPQALARFFYIELKHYGLAEMWAKKAIQRDPTNSFIIDTLGQVHKNHLKNKGEIYPPRKILQIAKKGIDVFKDEEQLAEEESPTDMTDDEAARFSHIFNCRGQFGFLQVCNLLYDLLVKRNLTWKAVFTQSKSFCSQLENLGDNKLYRFDDLVRKLKGEVEKKAEFFAEYLTFSKLNINKDDPEYISQDTYECQKKFAGDLPPKQGKPNAAQCEHELQQNFAATSAGVLACMDRECSGDLLNNITECWKEMCSKSKSESSVTNFILAYVLSLNLGVNFPYSPEALIQKLKQKTLLSHNAPPEQHMLTLLLCWPTGNGNDNVTDLSQQIEQMQHSYESKYFKYFRRRYLYPLFFIGNGQDLKRFVHRKVLEDLFSKQSHQTDSNGLINWRNDYIFQNNKVKEHLLKFEGVVRDYRLFLTIGNRQIEIQANLQRSLWKKRQVSFFLGFTIRGPVAFRIQTKNWDTDLKKLEDNSAETI